MIILIQATSVSMDDIMEFDSECFVVKNSPLRRPFLEYWIRVAGGASYVALDDKGRAVGFGCMRPSLRAHTHLIGPLYAVNDAIAHALVAHLSRDVAGDVLVLSIRCVNIIGD